MYRTRIVARTIGLGMLLAGMGALAAQRAPSSISLPLLASETIPCDQSPFGRVAPMVRDLEPLYLLNTSTDKRFEEWRPSLTAETPPLQQVYQASIETPSLAGKTLRKAVNADLNGDGRDEVVAASSNGSNVILTVYERSAGLSPAPQAIDTWTFTETEDGGGSIDPASIDMVAGDLDGSRDKQQEIAISWHIASGNHNTDTRVVVLKGDSAGRIAQADNATAGNWRAGYGSTLPRLAVGDFLLSGRDQLVLVNYTQGGTYDALNYDLIEFDDGSHGTTPTATLSPGLGSNMYFKHFWNDLKDTTHSTHYFADDNGNSRYMSHSGNAVKALEADAGDVGDTAAAELVVHLMFLDSSSFNDVNASHQFVLGQRLLHFDTARDVNNAITDVTLGNPGAGDAGQSYDSGRVVEMYGSYPFSAFPYPAPSFAATIADVDGLLGKEIVTVRAGRAPTDSDADSGHLIWWAHKVQVRLKPSFQFKNQGADAGYVVAFTNNSHGPPGLSYDWDFGDGTSHSAQINPTHTYATAGPGNRNVSLTVTVPSMPNQQPAMTYTHTVNVTGAFDNTLQGDVPPPWAYRIDPVHTYSATHPDALYSGTSLVKIAAGDMNRDGLPEVFAVAKDINGTIHRHVFRRQANGSFGYAMAADNVAGVGYLDLLLSDFDGDSLNAVLSTTSGDCSTVKNRQVRALVWMPPKFDAVQGNIYRVAAFGRTTEVSSSNETRSGSYTADSFSATIGFGFEIDIPVVAVKLGEFEMTSTFSYGLQAEKGKTHGYETSYSIDEGYSMGDNGNTEQEGVMSSEENTSDCYSYNVLTSSGILPNSKLTACRLKPGQDGTITNAYGPLEWNQLTIVDPALPPIAVPPSWVPAQRDWASLALFHAPAAGSALGRNSVGFSASHEADKATDGLFTTAAESDQAYNKPYLEIDLGEVRDIMAIRVFPTSDVPTTSPFGLQPISFKKAVVDLRGFRLYASATPFASDITTPTSAATTTFVPNGVSTFVQDYGSESVYSNWNIWTGNPGANSTDPDARMPLHARYLRLQKPTGGKIRIAEIQVFGDTHAEPPAYPDGVCDKTVGDGLFLAQVYDTVHGVSKAIEVRGDMIWSGAVNPDSPTTGVTDALGACENDSTSTLDSLYLVDARPIWVGQSMIGSGNHVWNLTTINSETHGSYTSIDHNFNVAVEVQASAAGVIGGYGFELGGGITQEHSSSMAWGNGFNVGGNLTGVSGHAACAYFPRPYAFRTSEFSNDGSEHAMYVTDYVVRQPASAWQRGAVPAECLVVSDPIFANGFQ